MKLEEIAPELEMYPGEFAHLREAYEAVPTEIHMHGHPDLKPDWCVDESCPLHEADRSAGAKGHVHPRQP